MVLSTRHYHDMTFHDSPFMILPHRFMRLATLLSYIIAGLSILISHIIAGLCILISYIITGLTTLISRIVAVSILR